MRTFIRTLLLGAALAFGLAQAQTVIKYAHFQPGSMDQPKHAAAMAFKSYVEGATGGELEVEIYPASQLGDAATVLEGLQLGTIEMGVVHDGPIASFFKPIEVLQMPYLFPNQAVAWEVFDGPFMEEFGEAMRAESDMQLLGVGDNGIRHFTNDVREVVTPEDMDGLKIRVQPSPIYQNLVESLGASPSAISWPELPSALQQGVVDGQENGVTNILAADLYQNQRYITLDGHVYSVHLYLMSGAFWDQLDEEQQRIVQTGADIAEGIHRGMTTAQDMNAESILTEVGMEVTVLSPDEIAAFREIAQPAVEEYLRDAVGDEWVDSLFEAVEAAQN
ncbi:MAG: TRAP transporter substrate-binding protein DctP [Trueperaceae bacterium]|nr:TRAP transporter substrate-binding protein DctP [Trueperaceae bacterium]